MNKILIVLTLLIIAILGVSSYRLLNYYNKINYWGDNFQQNNQWLSLNNNNILSMEQIDRYSYGYYSIINDTYPMIKPKSIFYLDAHSLDENGGFIPFELVLPEKINDNIELYTQTTNQSEIIKFDQLKDYLQVKKVIETDIARDLKTNIRYVDKIRLYKDKYII